MIKTPISLQDLRRKIYVKAKAESQWRFWGLYTHICKIEVLQEAYRLAKRNNGAPGIDGVTFAEVEASGVDLFLAELQQQLQKQTYKPLRGKRVKILKADGKSFRELNIPSIGDRVVQGAVKLILEPIFEADFQEGSYGYRPKRQAAEAIACVSKAIITRKTRILDLDISKFFDNVRHDVLLQKIAMRVQDKDVLRLVRLILKATSKRGLSQGGPLSPLASNIYLNSIDKMLEKAKLVTQGKGHNNLEYVRWADDMVIMIDYFKRHTWLMTAVTKRLKEELGKLGLEMNENKTKIINFSDPKQSFKFMGFDFRACKTRKGGVGAITTPTKQARNKLQSKIKETFRTNRGKSVQEVVKIINPILRGWVNYFRIGNSADCFAAIKDWVEKKARRHIYRAKQQKGFGWKRWSKEQIYQYTQLYNDYGIRYYNS